MRKGFTLVELLIVIAIIGVLMALLFPAIQAARESANMVGCQNNLRQVGIAMQLHHDRLLALPPSRISTPRRHGWAASILPYMEGSDNVQGYVKEDHWSSVSNRPIRKQVIPSLQCPSLTSNRLDTTAGGTINFPTAVSDYAPISAVSNRLSVHLGYTPTTFPTMLRLGALLLDRRAPIQEIIDGTSCTILIAECADRPNRWQLTKSVGNNVSGAGWAADDAAFEVDGTDYATATVDRGDCVVNCTNANEVYGFHPAGANVVFVDGSVHLLGPRLDPRTMVALITRRAGDRAPIEDY